MSRRRKQQPSVVVETEDTSTGVPGEEILAEGSEELEAAIVEAVEAYSLGGDEPLDDVEIAADPATVDELVASLESDPETLEASGDEAVEGIEVVEAEGDAEADEPGAAELPTSATSMDPVQLKQLVEALIFASDKPITVQRLRQLTRVSDIKRLEATLAEITTDYENRGLVLQQVSGGFQFRTRPQFSAWVQQLIAGRPVRLSRAQLETLAIVAYRQPITRPEIDDIRGVDSSATLKLLMDRALIRVLGKKEEVGRPMLYGTTKEFLDFFSLGDLRELPTLREYSELTDESRKVMSDRLGIAPDGSGGDEGGGSSGGGPIGGDGGPMGGDDGGAGGSDAFDASALSDAASEMLTDADERADVDLVAAAITDAGLTDDAFDGDTSEADLSALSGASDVDASAEAVALSGASDDDVSAETAEASELSGASDEASAETAELSGATNEDVPAGTSEVELSGASDDDVSAETAELSGAGDVDVPAGTSEVALSGADEHVSAETAELSGATDEDVPAGTSEIELSGAADDDVSAETRADDGSPDEVFASGSAQFAAVSAPDDVPDELFAAGSAATFASEPDEPVAEAAAAPALLAADDLDAGTERPSSDPATE